MANPSSNTSLSNSASGSKKILIIVIIAIVVIVLGYALTRNNNDQQSGTKNNASSSEASKKNGDIEKPMGPSEIFSYTGEVTSVTDGQISLLAKPGVNFLEKNTEFTVKVDSFTAISSMSLPTTRPDDSDPNPFKKKAIKLTDIKVGDQITVISDVNIKDKIEFAASRIEVIKSK